MKKSDLAYWFIIAGMIVSFHFCRALRGIFVTIFDSETATAQMTPEFSLAERDDSEVKRDSSILTKCLHL